MNPIAELNGDHRWKFFQAGGTNQVRLESAEDFLALEELDQKLWVALSCPTRGVEFDHKTLDLIDSDKDGRIRAPEVIAAVQWATERLKNPGDLAQGADVLPLDAINEANPGGKQILASAVQILQSLLEAATKSAQESKAAAAQQAFDIGKTAGILAAIGLALGGIGAAMAVMLDAFTKLPLWQKPIIVIGLLLVISGPSVLIAWLKLRQRNLGPILDANGWAVNGRVKINIPFGAALTATAKLPPDAERSLADPYADKHPARGWLILCLIAALAGGLGYWYWRVKHPTEPPKVENIQSPTNRAGGATIPSGGK